MFDNSIVKISFPVQETALNIARARNDGMRCSKSAHRLLEFLAWLALAWLPRWNWLWYGMVAWSAWFGGMEWIDARGAHVHMPWYSMGGNFFSVVNQQLNSAGTAWWSVISDRFATSVK